MATYKPILVAATPAAENPFFGHGGSYRFDPDSGQTALIERAGSLTETAVDPAAPDPIPATPSYPPAQE